MSILCGQLGGQQVLEVATGGGRQDAAAKDADIGQHVPNWHRMLRVEPELAILGGDQVEEHLLGEQCRMISLQHGDWGVGQVGVAAEPVSAGSRGAGVSTVHWTRGVVAVRSAVASCAQDTFAR